MGPSVHTMASKLIYQTSCYTYILLLLRKYVHMHALTDVDKAIPQPATSTPAKLQPPMVEYFVGVCISM